MEPLQITRTVFISPDEIDFTASLAGGPGGQHVNKASSAVELRFDIQRSFLPERYKTKLLDLSDRRITKDGVILIRARGERSQWQNRQAACRRLVKLIQGAIHTPKKRVPTKPSAASKERRLKEKARRARLKQSRRPPGDD